jgi:hypothetical protein
MTKQPTPRGSAHRDTAILSFTSLSAVAAAIALNFAQPSAEVIGYANDWECDVTAPGALQSDWGCASPNPLRPLIAKY